MSKKYVELVKDEMEKIGESAYLKDDEFINSLRSHCQKRFTLREIKKVKNLVADFDGDKWELAEILTEFFFHRKSAPSPVCIANLVSYVFYGGDLESLRYYVNTDVVSANFKRFCRNHPYL